MFFFLEFLRNYLANEQMCMYFFELDPLRKGKGGCGDGPIEEIFQFE